MFIDSAKNTMRFINAEDGITNDGTHYLIRMRRDASKFYMDNIDLQLSEENLQETAEFISEITGLECNTSQVTLLLKLYPHVRIKIAEYNGISDTDVRDGISQAVAHFFLGCEWPTFGDEIDIEQFVEFLKKEAIHHGFTPLTQTQQN